MKKERNKFQIVIAKLQNMVEVDQAMRNHCEDNLHEWNETVDRQNTECLKAIVDEIG